MENDIPYFQDLILFLKQDERLKKHFHEKDYFAVPKIDPDEIDQTSNMPIQKGLWVYPGETTREGNERRLNCVYRGVHRFYVTILLDCNRDQYVFKKKNGEVVLAGPVMELVSIRKTVKEAIRRFSLGIEKQIPPKTYNFLTWEKDEMIDYMGENGCGMLNATSIFSIELI